MLKRRKYRRNQKDVKHYSVIMQKHYYIDLWPKFGDILARKEAPRKWTRAHNLSPKKSGQKINGSKEVRKHEFKNLFE